MTIKFKTVDGRTVETTDKAVFFTAARNGEITPDTIIEVDGRPIKAGQVMGVVFNESSATPEPTASTDETTPDKILSSIEILRGVVFAVAGICVLAGFLIIAIGHNYFFGVGMIIGSAVNAYATNLFLDILAYIVKNVTPN